MNTDRNKILIVDDDREKATLLSIILRHTGFEILKANNAQTALNIIDNVVPDLFMLDINMPEMNGYELCRILKSDKRVESVPVIFISALGDEGSIIEGFKSGGVDYISVPFSSEVVLARVNIHLKLRNTQLNLETKNTELKLMKDNLENEVQLRTKDIENANKSLKEELNKHKITAEKLEVAKEQAESVSKELEDFSYSISHDLRAPLRHLTGFVNLLKKKGIDGLDEKSRHYLSVISESAEKMGKLIDSLLSFLHMREVKISKTRFNIESLVKESIEILMKYEEKINISFSVSPMPVVFADPEMLGIVLLNLISNAIKFTSGKPDAKVEIGYIPNDDLNEDIFFVKDNGVGFDMKYIDKLFTLFNTLHSSEEFEGTGLGLANTQRIIQRHGGMTWAKGEVDKGATFYFSLPKEGNRH